MPRWPNSGLSSKCQGPIAANLFSTHKDEDAADKSSCKRKRDGYEDYLFSGLRAVRHSKMGMPRKTMRTVAMARSRSVSAAPPNATHAANII